MSQPRRLRAGLIGAGTIAFSAHLPALRRLRDRIELVAVCDIREENADRAASEFGAERHYTDYQEMLAREELDFVDICTPEFLHADQTEAAATHHVHVLCEKPMSGSLADADRMIAAAEAAGIKLMIAHSRRFTGRYRRIREAIDAGDIGEVRYVRENERRPRAMYSGLSLGTDHWSPSGDASWLELPEFSAGAAMVNAVHETDLARWFIGQQPSSIHAEARVTNPEGQVPDMISYTVTFENGAIAAAEVVNQLPPGYPYFHQMEVLGTTGQIMARDPDQAPLTVADERGMTQPANFPTLLHVDQAYVNEISAFADSILNDTPPPVDPHEARGAIELSVAAVISSQRAQRINLPLQPGEDLNE